MQYKLWYWLVGGQAFAKGLRPYRLGTTQIKHIRSELLTNSHVETLSTCVPTYDEFTIGGSRIQLLQTEPHDFG